VRLGFASKSVNGFKDLKPISKQPSARTYIAFALPRAPLFQVLHIY
jgi:hypothetical protein